MAKSYSLTLSAVLEDAGERMGDVVADVSVEPADADGKFSVASLKVTVTTDATAVELPKGNCAFGSVRVVAKNMSTTAGEDVVLVKEVASSAVEIGRIKPGECFIAVRNATLFAYTLSGTPTLKVFCAQV